MKKFSEAFRNLPELLIKRGSSLMNGAVIVSMYVGPACTWLSFFRVEQVGRYFFTDEIGHQQIFRSAPFAIQYMYSEFVGFSLSYVLQSSKLFSAGTTRSA